MLKKLIIVMNEQNIVKRCDHFGILSKPPDDAPCWVCLGFVECKLKAGIPVIQDDIDMVEKLERGVTYGSR